jgi:preprotein translocase subunit SecD
LKLRVWLFWILKVRGLLMRHRVTTAIAIVTLASIGFACSVFRRNHNLTWNLLLEVETAAPDKEGAVQRTVTVIERRLDAFGVHNAKVLAQGTPPSGRILVSLPDVPDRQRLKELIIAGGLLELVAVVGPPSPAPVQTYGTKEEAAASLTGNTAAKRRVLPYLERGLPKTGETAGNRWVVVEAPAIVDGSDLRDAAAGQSYSGSDDYQISFSLGPAGAEKFGTWTSSHINDYLGVVLNGEVKSIAYIKSRITDQGEINGRFTKQAAEDLALILRTGALPAPVKIIEESATR